MMTDKETNRGAIWKNERKEKETHPDLNGSLNVDGVEYWVSAWRRPADANPKAPALKFSIKRKEEQQQKEPEHDSGEVEDPIPF